MNLEQLKELLLTPAQLDAVNAIEADPNFTAAVKHARLADIISSADSETSPLASIQKYSEHNHTFDPLQFDTLFFHPLVIACKKNYLRAAQFIIDRMQTQNILKVEGPLEKKTQTLLQIALKHISQMANETLLNLIKPYLKNIQFPDVWQNNILNPLYPPNSSPDSRDLQTKLAFLEILLEIGFNVGKAYALKSSLQDLLRQEERNHPPVTFRQQISAQRNAPIPKLEKEAGETPPNIRDRQHP